jgi:hypothetical protein
VVVLRSEADFTDPDLPRERRWLALFLLVHLVDEHGRLDSAYRRILRRAGRVPGHWAQGMSLGAVRADVMRWIGVHARADSVPPWDRIADLINDAVHPRRILEVLATARYLHCMAAGVENDAELHRPEWLEAGMDDIITTTIIGGPGWARKHGLPETNAETPVPEPRLPAPRPTTSEPTTSEPTTSEPAATRPPAPKPPVPRPPAAKPAAPKPAAPKPPASKPPASKHPVPRPPASQRPKPRLPETRKPETRKPAVRPLEAKPPEPRTATSESSTSQAPQRTKARRPKAQPGPQATESSERQAYQLLWTVVRVHREAQARITELEHQVEQLRRQNAQLSADVTGHPDDHRPAIPDQTRRTPPTKPVADRHLTLEDPAKPFTYPLPAELPEPSTRSG